MKKPPESRREVKFPDDPPWKLPFTTLHLSPPFQPQSAPVSKSPNSCGYQKLPSHIKQTAEGGNKAATGLVVWDVLINSVQGKQHSPHTLRIPGEGLLKA